ncbi:MAG TPA: cytochrome c family protein, partial [Caulobacteraceae bacterium]
MSDDLKLNKILGAGLATVFAILIVKEVSTRVYAEHPAEKAGYAIAIPEVAEGGGAAAVLPVDWGTVLPTADAAKGGTAFARCAACHTITQGGANGIGPNLFGVVGRRPASHAGFAYSEAMTQHAGEAPAWTYDELDAFIRAPNRHVPGTKMSFAGLKDTDTRVALIAYLRSQGSGGYAIPAPDPARQPGAAAPAEGAVPAPVA